MRHAALLLFPALLASAPLRADPMDDAIRAEMKRSHVPGVGIAVVRNGKIILEKGYGVANVEHNVAVTPKTVFQSGSVGKTFTAALIMLLAEDGKLTLDDPVSKHLANTPKAWEGITIRHLLTHTSGLGDPYEKLDFRKDYTDEDLIALEAALPTLFAPGEKWQYSNMGYHLLGFIANKAGGKFYGDQLRERIFAPLGMQTRVISEADIIPHRAAGYEVARGVLKNQSWVSPRLNTTADGSLYLTARDLALWDIALYGNKVLSDGIRTASWTPAKLNNGKPTSYGYGWQVDTRNGHRTMYHGGSWQGFKAFLARYPDDKLSVAVLANSASARPNRFADIVAAHYVPELAVKKAVAIADAQPAVTARLRQLIEGLRAGTAPSGTTAKVAAAYTPEWIKRVSEALADWGQLRSIELISVKTDGELQRSDYRVILEREALRVGLGLDQAGQIAALNLRPE